MNAEGEQPEALAEVEVETDVADVAGVSDSGKGCEPQADDLLRQKLLRYQQLLAAGIPDPLVDLAVVCEILDVSGRFVEKWQKAGRIRCHVLAGRMKKYIVSEVLRDLEGIGKTRKPGRPRKRRF